MNDPKATPILHAHKLYRPINIVLYTLTTHSPSSEVRVAKMTITKVKKKLLVLTCAVALISTYILSKRDISSISF